jgi:hypothetical protein
MTAIHHTIIKAVAKAGASINEFAGKFVLTNDDLGLRAESDDARELRALAQKWAEGEDQEDYVVEDQIEETEESDEDVLTGSVVKGHYKRLYKEQGHPDNCGDWLATFIRDRTRNARDELVLESFTAIMEANGINDWAKYLNGNNGATGRMVMNCSNRLRTIVRKTGVVHTSGPSYEAPESFMKKG